MKKSIVSVLMVLSLLCGSAFAKSIASEKKDVTDKEHDGFLQISSVSIDVMQYGITKPGAGLNYNYERYLGAHMAISAIGGGGFYFGSWMNLSELILMGSGGLNIRLYPMHDSLHGLYFGSGAGADAMLYLGPNEVPSDTQRVFGYVKPEIGWKLYLLKHFMIDVNASYKWQTVFDKDLPEFYKKDLDTGFHCGVGFKFFWK